VALATAPPEQVLEVVRRSGAARKIRPGLISPTLPFDDPEPKTGLISSESVPKIGPGLIRPSAPMLEMPATHALGLRDLDPRHLESVLLSTYERAPRTFEALLGLEGVGPRTLRALALVSEVIYGTPMSARDPARFAFAHGGKDGTPFPVDRQTYDRTIDVLHRAMASARVDRSEKLDALKRLGRFAKVTEPRASE
jgi:hypothetical protein